MKALVYKDTVLIFRQMRLFLLVILALFLLVQVVSFGALRPFLAPTVGLAVPLHLAAYDERSRWTSLTPILPYSPGALVLSRCLVSWGMVLLGGLLSLIAALLTAPDHSISLTDLQVLEWLVAGTLFALAFLFPLLIRVNVIHGQIWSLVLLLAAVVTVLNFLGTQDEDKPWAVFPVILPHLIPLAHAALGIALAANLVSVPLTIWLAGQRQP